MPITTYSRDEIAAQVLAFFRVRFPGRDLGDDSWLGKQSRAVAMALLLIQKGIEDADHDAVPGPLSSTLALDNFAIVFGLPSNKGGYGRNGAVAATGAAGNASGTKGITFSDGLLLTASDGVTTFQLQGAVTIPGIPPGTDNALAHFVAVTPGAAGNLSTGAVLRWQSPPAGGDATVTLTSPSQGGLDAETDRELLQRIFDRLQQPPKGGANIDYITWATEQPGVYKAYVYPRRGGTGTVDLVIVSAGSGDGRIPPESARLAVVAFILQVQPTNVEGFSVYVPQMPADKDLTIHVRAELAPKYAWDWSDIGLALTVAGYNAGTPSITLSAPAPATLTGAVDLGLKPRLQVVSASLGAPVIPEQPRVVAYDVTKTILTLEAVMATAPTAGDSVYAGSYAAPLVAQAVLDFVDSLGPSRKSPYADVVNVWDDTVALYTIATKATDALDVDGVTKLLARVPATDSLGGPSIDIAVGASPPAAVDYQPGDGGGWPLAPEIAKAKHVFVTQS